MSSFHLVCMESVISAVEKVASRFESVFGTRCLSTDLRKGEKSGSETSSRSWVHLYFCYLRVTNIQGFASSYLLQL